MLSILFSTIAFFVATYYLRRYLDGMDIPKSMTRGTLIFTAALLISYLVAWLVNFLLP